MQLQGDPGGSVPITAAKNVNEEGEEVDEKPFPACIF